MTHNGPGIKAVAVITSTLSNFVPMFKNETKFVVRTKTAIAFTPCYAKYFFTAKFAFII